jgi:hypothetical protein
MTVRELIAELETVENKDRRVVIYIESLGAYGPGSYGEIKDMEDDKLDHPEELGEILLRIPKILE